MRPFHTIAVPHHDILEGHLTMDVFAADLWEVYNGRGPDEYKEDALFFQKTYETEGLKNLLFVVKQRLEGLGGDPVIQLQTPFGGGKTHALIAIYHRAAQWGATRVAIVGTALSSSDTLWGVLEKQLTGRIKTFSGLIPPGRDDIVQLLSEHQPTLILMDEVLQYMTRAAGVQVGETTLAAQTIAFIQALTEAAKIGKTALVLTLPSSVLEHYDEEGERLWQQLQHVTGRMEAIYAPVQENEITSIIRRRLFSEVDLSQADHIIDNYLSYAKKESLLPADVEPSEYRRQFELSYPFTPDVIGVLYRRWGSFPNFQRTRGVLRLLSLVIASKKDSNIPYVGLADFPLGNQQIRQELLKHIGQNFDSIVAADISGIDANAKKVDSMLGEAYQGLKLGTRAATVVFMYSFSGGQEKGASLIEIKRNATTLDNPSAVVAEALEQLKSHLYYLDLWSGKYYFTTEITYARALNMKKESVEEGEIDDLEYDVLKSTLIGDVLKTRIWPKQSVEIPDDADLKLAIMKRYDDALMRQILETKGGSPRVNRNILFFLAPLSSEQNTFREALRTLIANRLVIADHTLLFSAEQMKQIKSESKRCEDGVQDDLRRYYRLLLTPGSIEFKERDLGIPTYGESRAIDEAVYQTLRSEDEVLERISPLVIKEKYLSNKDAVLTRQIYTSTLTTLGEIRFRDQAVLANGIAEGVKQGLFGLGVVKDALPECLAFKKTVECDFLGAEAIVDSSLCKAPEALLLSLIHI